MFACLFSLWDVYLICLFIYGVIRYLVLLSGSRNEGSDCETCSEVLEVKDVAKTVGDEKIDVVNDLESCSSSGSLKEFGDLPSQALSYIQQLESELTSVMEVTLLFLSV